MKATYEVEASEIPTPTEIQNILRLLSRDPHLTVRPVDYYDRVARTNGLPDGDAARQRIKMLEAQVQVLRAG